MASYWNVHLEEIRPQASMIYIRCLPQRYRTFICNLLDVPSALGKNDYRIFGERLGCTHLQVQALKSNNVGRSVTGALLDEFQNTVTIWKLIEILSSMGVSGVQEILEYWPEVLSLYHREQEQLSGWGRHGVQNVEGSCACQNCQVNYLPYQFQGHHQVMSAFPQFVPDAPHFSPVSHHPGDVAMWQGRNPSAAHGRMYQGYGGRPAGQGAGTHGHVAYCLPGHRKSPEHEEDMRRLVRQTALDSTSMNIPPEEALTEVKHVSGMSQDEYQLSRRYFRSMSDEDNCSYESESETDSHGNQNIASEQQAVAEVHRQDRGGSPTQAGTIDSGHQQSLPTLAVATSCADEVDLLQGLELEDSDDTNWIPPDNVSVLSLMDGASLPRDLEIVQDSPFQEASITSSPETSVAEREYERSHGTSKTQMAHLDNNGKHSMTSKPPNPVTEGKLASKQQRHHIMADVPVTHYSVPPQGYPECQSHLQEQTMRKMPFSTTEAYICQQQYRSGQYCPQPAVSCSGLDCACGGYSWHPNPEMSRPGMMEAINSTSLTVLPNPNTRPQALHSPQGAQGLPALHIPYGSRRSPPLQSPLGSTGSPALQIPQKPPGSQALHIPPQWAQRSSANHIPQGFQGAPDLHIPQGSPIPHSPVRSPQSPALHIPQRSQRSIALHSAQGSPGVLLPDNKVSSPFNPQVTGLPDASPEHVVSTPTVHPQQDVECELDEQPEVPRRDQAARRGDFGKIKCFSDPSPPRCAPDLQRCLSDDRIQYIYQREEEAENFVFITGGELKQQKKVEDHMWKICAELHKNKIPFVANLQQELFAYPGDPLKTRHKLRENVNEGMIEYFKKATCVLLVVSPGYKEYIDKNNDQASPSSHQISTRYIYTEMIDEHCRINFCKNKRFYPVKLKALETKTEHIPDWMASTLIYNFPKNKAELIQHLKEDLSHHKN